MSLEKIFHLSCDSNHLLWVREFAAGATLGEVRAKAPQRIKLRAGCMLSGPSRTSAKAARSAAKEAGWVRHVENNRHGGPERFDLCAVCAPKVVQS